MKHFLNWKLIIILFVFSIVIVCDTYLNYRGYLTLSNKDITFNFLDIFFLSTYGVNDNSNLFNSIKWCVYIILIVYPMSLYIKRTIFDRKKYFFLIRGVSLRKWIIKNYIKSIGITCIYSFILNISIALISFTFFHKSFYTSDIFNIINVNMAINKLDISYILIQMLIYISLATLLLSLQICIYILFKSDNLGGIFSIILICILSIFCENTNINFGMLSKCIPINTMYNTNPYLILTTNILLSILVLSLSMISINKKEV